MVFVLSKELLSFQQNSAIKISKQEELRVLHATVSHQIRQCSNYRGSNMPLSLTTEFVLADGDDCLSIFSLCKCSARKCTKYISVNLNFSVTTVHVHTTVMTFSFSRIREFLEHLRGFVVGACDLSTGEPTPSTHSTLIHSLVGSNHLVAACLHALALDTHRRGVRATGCPINHLQ